MRVAAAAQRENARTKGVCVQNGCNEHERAGGQHAAVLGPFGSFSKCGSSIGFSRAPSGAGTMSASCSPQEANLCNYSSRFHLARPHASPSCPNARPWPYEVLVGSPGCAASPQLCNGRGEGSEDIKRCLGVYFYRVGCLSG